MRIDSRLSRMLHVLLHMQSLEGAVTSAMIADMLNTNPVVVRRTMASLKEQGYVKSEKGHGGGWSLACDLEQVTLLDIYRALGETPVFAMGVSIQHPECLVERAVNDVMNDAFNEARQQLLERFGSITLADIARDFNLKMAACEKEPQ